MAACGTEHLCPEEIDEKNDPGAAPYGNFINYYTFNPPENRLNLIPATLLQDLGYNNASHDQPTLILDVGCNSGELTVALPGHLNQKTSSEGGEKKAEGTSLLHILGFDLDERLIRRAQENNPLPQVVSFVRLDVTEDDSQGRLLRYAEQHGGCPRFHVCLCLAVTMWVHLNHGDEALLALLSRLAAVSEHLLLEAQPWKCYRSAARRLRKVGRGSQTQNFDHFKTLKIRGDMAEHARAHLESECCGMELVQSFGSTAWDRRLLLFRRK